MGLLDDNQDLQPSSYGITGAESCDSFSNNNEQAPKAYKRSYLSLRYCSSRKLNECYFARTWKSLTTSFAQDWGIPVPLHLHLVKEDSYPKRLICFGACNSPEESELIALRLQVEANEDKYIITPDMLP